MCMKETPVSFFIITESPPAILARTAPLTRGKVRGHTCVRVINELADACCANRGTAPDVMSPLPDDDLPLQATLLAPGGD